LSRGSNLAKRGATSQGQEPRHLIRKGGGSLWRGMRHPVFQGFLNTEERIGEEAPPRQRKQNPESSVYPLDVRLEKGIR